MSNRLKMAEEIFEGNGEMLDQSLQSEELFQDMQEVLFKLVKKYEVCVLYYTM